jgi:hypothetical protein
MRTNTTSNLTDNAWVQRIDELRQMVWDNYDTTATPDEFIEWFVDGEDAEEAFYDDDIRILRQEAQRMYEEETTS